LYEIKMKELKKMYADLEEKKYELFHQIDCIENQLRGMDRVDFPYLEMAINKRGDRNLAGYILVPKVDQHWFKKMVATYGAWSKAEV